MVRLFTLAEALHMSGSSLHNCSRDPQGIAVCGAAVDSRKLEEGFLFVALKGERTDGHCFIRDAEKRGATAALVSVDFIKSMDGSELVAGLSMPLMVHEDPLAALQQLAAAWVDRFPQLIRIGVTGSNGKSTTKELLAAILSASAPTVKNPGNLNSEIGLPLAVLQIGEEHRYGVFEMGVNHQGEMEQMVRVLRPRHGLITNVGTAHIGLLGSREGIAREKVGLFSALPSDGFGFYPEGFEWIDLFRSECAASLVSFGLKSTEGIESVEALGLKGWRIRYEARDLHLAQPGKHNLNNCLAAIQVARSLGIGPDEVKRGVEKVMLLEGRSQVIDGEVTIVHDGYNANTESMMAMLATLRESIAVERLIVVLASMKELGDDAEAYHRLLGRELAGFGPKAVLLFGGEMRAAYEEAARNGYRGILRHTNDFEELRTLVSGTVCAGDTVLLKGSRSMELERLIPVLRSPGLVNQGC